jgi:hypothetical protein
VRVLSLRSLFKVLLSFVPNTNRRLKFLLLLFLINLFFIELQALIKVDVLQLLQKLRSLIKAKFKYVLVWVNLLNHLRTFCRLSELERWEFVNILFKLLEFCYISLHRIDSFLQHLMHFSYRFHELIQVDCLHHQVGFVN